MFRHLDIRLRYPKALEDFEKTSAIDPKYKFGLAGQALSRYALGQVEEAKQLWEKLIETDKRFVDPEAV